jgi:hypothetical protein
MPSMPTPSFDPSAPAFDLPESKLNDPEHWRSRAQEVRGLADDAKAPDVLAMLLRLAADYDRVADAAERRRP